MAFMAAAPEAEAAVAGSGAGGLARGRARGRKAPNRRRPAGSGSTPGTPPELIPTTEELADRQPADPAPPPPGAGSAAPSWSPGPIRVGNAGGGLVLGSLAYVVGLTYLRGGREGVKALVRAKFLNKVS